MTNVNSSTFATVYRNAEAECDTFTDSHSYANAGTDTAGQTVGALPRTGENTASLVAGALTALLGGLGLRRLRPRPASR